MHWKNTVVPVLVVLFGIAAVSAHSQVTPSANEPKIPITVGAGFSNYETDFDEGARMNGITAWVDWRIRHLPPHLDGLGIELEGHDINYNRPDFFPRLREDTALGGPFFQFRHYHRIRPYVKFMMGMGSIDFQFPGGNPYYTHDTRQVIAPGGGIDYRLWKRVSVRGDYEYQFWPGLFNHTLNPNGVTVGAVYNFGARSY